jgi:hypothetical protein
MSDILIEIPATKLRAIQGPSALEIVRQRLKQFRAPICPIPFHERQAKLKLNRLFPHLPGNDDCALSKDLGWIMGKRHWWSDIIQVHANSATNRPSDRKYGPQGSLLLGFLIRFWEFRLFLIPRKIVLRCDVWSIKVLYNQPSDWLRGIENRRQIVLVSF